MGKRIEDTEKLLLISPLRKRLEIEMRLPFEIENEPIDSIIKDLGILRSRIDKPLNLVVLGEVKSGKSTLVNALIGQELSPVDLCEATSCIIEIIHSDVQIGRIIKPNQQVIQGDLNSIVDLIVQNRNNVEYLQQIETVQLETNSTVFSNIHIIDTPGLATMNKRNEEITKQFIIKSDIVLWVFNANYLGQSDVSEFLSTTAKYGKPILGIINKTDQVDSETEPLIKYVNRQYGIYLQRIYPLSSSMAMEAIKKQDEELSNKSGLSSLIEYLKTVNQDSHEIHKKSLISSVDALIRKEIAYHEIVQHRTEFIVEQIKRFSDALKYHNDRIAKTMQTLFKQWYTSKLLVDEEQVITQEIDNMKFGESNTAIILKVKEALAEDNIKEKVQLFISELSERIKSEWAEALTEISEKMSLAAKEFENRESRYLVQLDAEGLSLDGFITDGLKKGAIIGGTIGLLQGVMVAAFTTATLSVLLVSVPVLLALGAVTGGVAKMFDFKPHKNKLRISVQNTFNKARNGIANHLQDYLYNEICKASKDYAGTIQENFNQKIANGHNSQDMAQFSHNLKYYILQLKSELESV